MTTREYLFALEQFGIKLGLDQIRDLLRHLGRPDLAYPSIVIAGTNGKGSVTAMLERGLRAAGYTTGRYTSPHLTNIEERVAIDGRPISPEAFDDTAAAVRSAAGQLPAPPTFFEATTALAVEAFRRARVDVGIFEVGLGGRLDATNVLSPMGVGITTIDFDHEEHLGRSLEAIAREKAGIIKPDRFCVLGENTDEVRRVIEQVCRDTHATFVFAPEGVEASATIVDGRTRLRVRTPARDYGDLTLSLRGRHQVQNAVTAVRMLEAIDGEGSLRVPPAAIDIAVTDVEWPARLELRRLGAAEVLIDGAHNPAGARALAAYITEAYGGALPIVFGAMKDKNIEEMIHALRSSASVLICTAPQSPRAATPAAIAALARRAAPDLRVIEEPSPLAAVRTALSLGAPAVVAGSLYLAGEVRAFLS